MTAVEELRQSTTTLRCDHRHPILPPLGSLAKPGDCSQCGAPYGHEPVSEPLVEPLAALLEYCAKHREAAETAAASVSDDSGRITADEIDQLTPHALPVARAINGGAR